MSDESKHTTPHGMRFVAVLVAAAAGACCGTIVPWIRSGSLLGLFSDFHWMCIPAAIVGAWPAALSGLLIRLVIEKRNIPISKVTSPSVVAFVVGLVLVAGMLIWVASWIAFGE